MQRQLTIPVVLSSITVVPDDAPDNLLIIIIFGNKNISTQRPSHDLRAIQDLEEFIEVIRPDDTFEGVF